MKQRTPWNGRATWIIVWSLLLAGSSAEAGEVGLVRVKGPISPASADYIERAIKVAHEQKLEALIIQLDTPGGLLDSTKNIVQALFASPVPTAVYVAPAGATAASAGTFITLAADVAAMAPTTTIGAAHPVMVGGESSTQTNQVMNQKLENYASSFVETIAGRRNRNVEWAKAAVRESATLTAQQALATNVIDILAEDVPDLLRQMNGRTVRDETLVTANARVQEIPMILRERVFQLFWRPEVMFILMLIAIYGIVAEVSNPGLIVPGTVGAIALVVALYMGAVLPINVAGIVLILLAVALFIAEVFTPTFGLLTAAGVAAFLVGGLMLFDRAAVGFRLPLGFIVSSAVLTAAFFLFVVGKGLKAQRLPVRVGKETLIGRTTTARTPIDSSTGKVFVEGELWSATSETPIAEGEPVEVVGSEGLILKVKPKGKGQ